MVDEDKHPFWNGGQRIERQVAMIEVRGSILDNDDFGNAICYQRKRVIAKIKDLHLIALHSAGINTARRARCLKVD